ncbi:MAG: hypothetical protein AAF447_23480 [Myxococcota bacterium]
MASPDQTHPLVPNDSPLVPDAVARPDVKYGESGATLDYFRRDGGWARVVFHRWDSLRVCRGELPPYPAADPGGPWVGLETVRPSKWLRERYGYESKHYRGRYAFNNDVDEMLEEFDHYLFSFHDEFVEVIAGGVHFDVSDEQYAEGQLHQRPGWTDLPEAAVAHRWEYSGILCQVRVDDRAQPDVLEASRFCDQAIVQVALELDGRASVSHRLAVRTRGGETKSRWRGYFGASERTFDGIPSLATIRPLVETHAAEVRKRRDAKGKT